MTTAQAVYGLLTDGKPRTYAQIATDLDASYVTVYKAARSLIEDGLVYVWGKEPTNRKPRDVVAVNPVPTLASLRRLLAPKPRPEPRPRSGRGSGSGRSPEAIQRAESMLRAYVDDDLTLEQIGATHNLTRERVRQIITAHDRTLMVLAQQRRQARIRLRNFVAKGTMPYNIDCRLCGGSFTTADSHNTAFCTPEHQQIWIALRYQINPTYRDHFRRLVANGRLRANPDDTYGHNVLAGTVGQAPSNAGQRWMVKGSRIHTLAMTAYTEGWPVFEMFHPDVQAQIRGTRV